MRRSAWTDERLDDKMGVIDSTFEMLRDEMQGMRTDLRDEIQGFRSEMRDEMRSFRDELRGEMQGFRGEMRDETQSFRDEMRGLRSDFNALQTTLIQIGFGLVGVLLAAMVALIVALA